MMYTKIILMNSCFVSNLQIDSIFVTFDFTAIQRVSFEGDCIYANCQEKVQTNDYIWECFKQILGLISCIFLEVAVSIFRQMLLITL